MCSLEKSHSSGPDLVTNRKSTENDTHQNYKKRRRQTPLDETVISNETTETTGTTTHKLLSDIENRENAVRDVSGGGRTCLSGGVLVGATFLAVLLLVLAAAAASLPGVDSAAPPQLDSSLPRSSSSLSAGGSEVSEHAVRTNFHPNFHQRKKRSRTRKLMFLDVIHKQKEQSSSLQWKRRKRSSNLVDDHLKGKNYISLPAPHQNAVEDTWGENRRSQCHLLRL